MKGGYYILDASRLEDAEVQFDGLVYCKAIPRNIFNDIIESGKLLIIDNISFMDVSLGEFVKISPVAIALIQNYISGTETEYYATSTTVIGEHYAVGFGDILGDNTRLLAVIKTNV